MNRKVPRYAHGDGHTDVCYSEDGKKLITCGTDGDIRIWSGFYDDDPIQTCVGEWSLCVRQKGSHLQVATDNNIVQSITYPEVERDGILIRFTAPVNHLAVGRDHNLIAIASEDGIVKVMNLNSNEEIFTYPSLPGPPLSIALSCNAKMVAVSCGDGILRVWDINSSCLLNEINCVPKANSFMNANLLCRVDFEPISGEALAYPERASVIIISTSDWLKKSTLVCANIKELFSIVQYSPCGKLIAAASEKGDIVVWDVSISVVIGIAEDSHSIAVCSMVWNPMGNGEIAFCNKQGHLGVIERCLSSSSVTDLNVESIEELCLEVVSGNNEETLEELSSETTSEHEAELNCVRGISPSPSIQDNISGNPLQDVFMPSSTPIHLNPRYLCWNEVGIIRSYGIIEDCKNDKSIEVEFHNTSLHNSMMMRNYQNYTMGSLSTTILVTANSSQVAMIPLTASSKEWITTFPDNEIICIAASNNLVCIATLTYLIHVFSIYGTQKAVFTVPGPIVCMSAWEYFVLIAYHGAGIRKGDQCIDFMLVNLKGLSIENKYLKSALGPKATLQWLGFTDLGTPALQDSDGMVSFYILNADVWIPLCNTDKNCNSSSDGFFITAVFESYQSVRGIQCKGSIYPMCTPCPMLTELLLQPPFVEINTEKSQLEAQLFTWSVLKVENSEKKIKETALKIFALSCKNSLEQRALELVQMISNPQLIILATKYAAKLKKDRLVEKLTELTSILQNENLKTDTINLGEVECYSDYISKPARKLNFNLDQKRNKQISDVNTTANTKTKSEVFQQDKIHSLEDATNNHSIVQESSFCRTESKNPFLKNVIREEFSNLNPLSLTNKSAGIIIKKIKDVKENCSINMDNDKRKNPDLETENGNPSKQRKLEKFNFKKKLAEV